MTPAQLTSEAPAPERQIEALRSLAMQKFLEALRRDIASKLQLSDGHFFLEIRFSIGLKINLKSNPMVHTEEKWIKGKLISVDGSMVGVDLGTRIVKVNISKIKKGSQSN